MGCGGVESHDDAGLLQIYKDNLTWLGVHIKFAQIYIFGATTVL